jgi:HK97 family phage prohead protease
MTDAERRFTSVPVEIRAGSDKRIIGGYAAKFNLPSQNLGGFREKIDTSFFNRSHGNGWPNVMARYNHEDNMLLGTSAAGTLRLGIDDVGLKYEVDVPRSREDVFELVERGDVRKSSFAFIVERDGGDDWTVDDSGFPMRTLLRGRLIDVAPVNMPAYEDTTVGARSLVNEMRRVGGAIIGAAAALESLATKFDAPIDEVRALAEANELMKLFKLTAQGGTPPERSAQAALALALSIKQ